MRRVTPPANPPYELFRDEAAFKAHQESDHFKTSIAGQALPLLARRERMQYGLI
ncbi:putative quinol monooxygenase [Bradyrhizobium oligotrophicum]|uniref:putative quinol monooxygenase n=1 Tax=Bradyrhizobium oligotrophicum TaxID=44255 RepID=UPI00034A0953|nr:antibiotic biosynthesis monooxygenase [Bradyrhizobium oligotrophicum]